MIKYGITSWDDVDQGKSEKKFNREDWLKLDQGDNEVRILTRPAKYLVHKFKIEGSAGFGSNIRCTTDKETCPLCMAGVKVTERFLLGVIDRKTNAYKILDIGPKLAQDLKAQNSDKKWGPISQYDINIKVDKQGGATGYYRVVPQPSGPLTEAEREIMDKIDLQDLAKRCAPYTTEKVAEAMAKEKARATGTGGMKRGAAMEAPVTHDESDEDRMTFPAVN